jgi:DNA-binding NarL/FixJ family response regulator
MDLPSNTVWVFDATSYPTARASLRSLLSGQTAIHLWSEPPGPAKPAGQDGVPDASQMQPDAPDAIVTALDNASGALERACLRWTEAGVVLLGMETATAFSIPSDRPLALLSLGVTSSQLVLAIQAVAVGLSVVHPDFLHPERGIQAVVTRTNQPDDSGHLTIRELQVLKLIADGLPNKTIAVELSISEHTVKFHVSSIFSKLGVASRTEAVTVATRRGILVV